VSATFSGVVDSVSLERGESEGGWECERRVRRRGVGARNTAGGEQLDL